MSEEQNGGLVPIGDGRLGDLARRQIGAARHDPRLSRGREAIVANYWDAVEEAERHRRMAMWGLYELAKSLEREEERLGIRRDARDLTASQLASLQAAWERSELARSELANEHPHLNALALVALQAALDTLVEELVPSWATAQRVEYAIRALEGETKAIWDDLPEVIQQRLRFSFVESLVERVAARLTRPSGGGATRYEAALAQAGLAAPPERPIPPDLEEALQEANALRNVVLHRGARVDARALEAAPTLRYEEGELVRISRADYRTYSAALVAYGAEIVRRLMRDLVDDVDLSRWCDYVELNA